MEVSRGLSWVLDCSFTSINDLEDGLESALVIFTLIASTLGDEIKTQNDFNKLETSSEINRCNSVRTRAENIMWVRAISCTQVNWEMTG